MICETPYVISFIKESAMKDKTLKKITYIVLLVIGFSLAFFDLPMLCWAANTNNFNVWNHLGAQPGVNPLFSVGGPGLYVLLKKFIIYSSAIALFVGLIALMVIRNPKVVLQRKQDMVHKITLIIFASGSVFFMNLLFKLCNAIFYR